MDGFVSRTRDTFWCLKWDEKQQHCRLLRVCTCSWLEVVLMAVLSKRWAYGPCQCLGKAVYRDISPGNTLLFCVSVLPCLHFLLIDINFWITLNVTREQQYNFQGSFLIIVVLVVTLGAGYFSIERYNIGTLTFRDVTSAHNHCNYDTWVQIKSF